MCRLRVVPINPEKSLCVCGGVKTQNSGLILLTHPHVFGLIRILLIEKPRALAELTTWFILTH